ncbi:MAG: NAD(P)/FAD-dependent oxidoreductase [Verrucomicrobiales bacterium]|nr:NAD(P)/FAD-dependent oxidoreductase [Verrucomicrobiales bacterium]
MTKSTYDFVVLGGGSAGYAAARTAHEHGMKTAVIDGADELGGLCILRGCMPSKTLIESANRFRSMRRAKEFGLRAENPAVKTDEIIERKRKLISEFAEYRQEQLKDGRFDLIRGTAIFTGPNSLVATAKDDGEEHHLEFRSAIVATGSVVSKIPITGLKEAGYWTSDDVLEAEELPDSIIVLGGGAIALEMACYFEGLGREVTLIQRSDQLLSGSDRDVAKALESAMMEKENLAVHVGTHLTHVTKHAETGRKTVHFEKGGEALSVEADQILEALGRSPNSAFIGADAAGIELDDSGKISCAPDQRTSVPHIFAGGDVCGPHEIVHIAIEQGEIAAHNAAVDLGFLSEPKKEIDYRLKLYGIFSDPEVAMVGMSEAEAKEAGIPFATDTYPFDDHGKSMVMGETHGFVKMMAHTETGEILGASVVGPHAVDLIHEIVVAMHFRCTTNEFIKIPHYHPTLSEIWTYPAEELSI